MANGNFSKLHPTAGTQDVFNLGQIVDQQSLADLCATLNAIVGVSSANAAAGAGKVCSLKQLVIDGTGAVATTAPTAGTLTVSSGVTVQAGGIAVTGNSTVTGTFSSTAAISKTVIMAPMGWSGLSYTFSTGPGVWTSTGTGSGVLVAAPINLPFNGPGGALYTITSVSFRVKPGGTNALECQVMGTNNQNTTSAPADVVQGTTNSDGTANHQTVTVGSLSLAFGAGQTWWAQVVSSPGNVGDKVYSISVTYTSPVF